MERGRKQNEQTKNFRTLQYVLGNMQIVVMAKDNISTIIVIRGVARYSPYLWCKIYSSSTR